MKGEYVTRNINRAVNLKKNAIDLKNPHADSMNKLNTK